MGNGVATRFFRILAARWQAYGLLATIAIVAAMTAGPAGAASVICASVWSGDTTYWGEWSGGPGAAMCELYEPASSELSREFGVDIKIWLPGETESVDFPGTTIPGWLESPHPDATPNAPELIVEAIRKTLSELKPHLDPIGIDMVLLQNVSGQGAGGNWDWETAAEALRGDPCPVTVYATNLIDVQDGGNTPVAPADVQSTIAHEIYHCYQKKYFRSQERAANKVDDGWWVEGTAEFVGNFLFPCGPNAAAMASDYRMGTRLNRQVPGGYADYVFYTHLADRHGFDFGALKDFTGGMATGPGAPAQNAALANYPEIGRKFHTFAQAYVDGEISHCVTGNLTFDKVAEYVAADGLEVPLDVEPFIFGASIVTFQKGKAYLVKLEDQTGDGERRKTSYRRGEDSGSLAWSPAPTTFTLTGGCEEENRFLFISTVEGTDNATHNAKLVFEELPESEAEDAACRRCNRAGWYRKPGPDQCLVGQWEWQSGGKWDLYREMFVLSIQRQPRTVSYSALSGARGNRLTIREDGTYEYGAGEVWLDGRGTKKRGDDVENFSHRLDAEVLPGIGAWKVDRGKLRVCDILTPGEGAFEYFASSEEGATLRGATEARAHQTQHIVKGKYDYACSESQLKITKSGPTVPGMPKLEWVYRRLSGGDGTTGEPPAGGG